MVALDGSNVPVMSHLFCPHNKQAELTCHHLVSYHFVGLSRRAQFSFCLLLCYPIFSLECNFAEKYFKNLVCQIGIVKLQSTYLWLFL